MKTILSDERPNSSNLSAALGLPLPAPTALVRVVGVIYDLGGHRGERAAEIFEEITGVYLVGAEARYPQTPPELFPLAALGVDGVHYGYVVHAPELGAQDYPIGELDPMSEDGLTLVGNSTLEALENLMSQQLRDVPQSAGTISEVARALGIEPQAAKADRPYARDGMGLPVVPGIPPGWGYLPSSDGVGVLAREATFAPGAFHVPQPDTPVASMLALADEALTAGFAASALYYLREAYWHHWTEGEIARQLSEHQARAYEALDRRALAASVRSRGGTQGRQGGSGTIK